MNTGVLRRRAVIGLTSAASLTMLVTGCGGTATAEGPKRPITKAMTVDGKAWQLEYASESDQSKFLDLAVVSEDEAWALTEGGGKTWPPNVLLRKQDGRWKQVPLPEGASKGMLMPLLEASAPDDVWLFWIGLEGARAARWDGERWTKLPADRQAKFGVGDAAVLGPDDVWTLTGKRTASHWDGEQWNSVKLPAAASAIDGRASDDVWAVGSTRGAAAEGGQPVAMHWDGEAWTKTKTPTYHFEKARPGERARLEAVAVLSETEVWALGEHGFDTEELDAEYIGDTFLMRWDGERWWKAPKAVGGSPRDFAGPKLRPVITADASGGVVLAGKQHWNGVDEVRTLQVPEMPAKLLPEQPQKYDRHLRLSGLEIVPGSPKVLGVGTLVIGSEAGGLHSRRGVIVTYDLPK